jgi:hypothetical protein
MTLNKTTGINKLMYTLEVMLDKLKKTPRLAIILVGFLAACAPAAIQTVDTSPSSPTEAINTPLTNPTDTSPAPPPAADLNLDQFVFVPLLPRDGIRPIYNPEFVEAIESPLHADELVMGVAINGEAKAYPVTVLRFREMVNDELGGGPILVTW